MAILQTAREHHRRSLLLNRRAVAQARDARNRSTVEVAASVLLHQITAAQLGEQAIGQMLLEQQIDTAAAALLDSTAFTTEVDRMVAMLEQVENDYEFDRLVGTLVADAGNAAEGVAIAVRERVGWVRQVTPPCCKRCAVLAGRFYRWSDGFERHPNCRCTHIPTTEREAKARGLVLNVDDLHEQGLVSDFTQAELEAIANGADIAQVVNIRRLRGDLQVSGRVLSRRGRLTPEGVIAQAGGDRDRMVELLGENGYLRGERTGSTARTPAPEPGRAGAQPPAPPRKPPTAPPPAPEPEPEPVDWAARQAALGIETHGQVLQPDDIEFAEHMLRADQSIEWIRTDANGYDEIGRRRPTDDFIWLNKDRLEVEAKRVQRAEYKTIKRAIADAVADARAIHDFPKQHFVIDIGGVLLTEKLRRQLERYNQRNAASGNTIVGLWILSRDEVHQITLE